MHIEHNSEKHTFYLYDEGRLEIGHILYSFSAPREITAVSTKIYPPNEGHGYAKLLVDALADYARQEGAKIIPKCPYVAALFQKHPERYGDIAR